MLSQLNTLIPGAEHWPRFVRNRSEQYEARLSLVEVLDSPSLLLAGMAGSRLPVVVAHGEGRAVFASGDKARAHVALRFIDRKGTTSELQSLMRISYPVFCLQTNTDTPVSS